MENTPKNDIRQLCRVSTVTALLIGGVTAIAGLLMRLFAYDEKMQLFHAGWPLSFYKALLVIGCLCAIAFLFLLKNVPAPDRLPPPGGLHTVCSALTGFFLLAAVALQLLFLLCRLDPGKYAVDHSFLGMWLTGSTGYRFREGLQMLSLLLAIPSGLYFLCPVFSEKTKNTPRVICGICFVFFCLAQTMVANFYTSEFPMNSPLRLEPMLAGSAGALYLLTELRFLLSKGQLNLLFAGGTIGLVLCGSYGLTGIVTTLLGRQSAGLSTVYEAIFLLLACCIALRLRAVARDQ